jgi:sugar phosphate isomerase/epimerase
LKVSIASYSFHGLLAEGRMNAFTYLEDMKYRYRLNTADFWNDTVGSTDEEFVRKVRRAMDQEEIVCVNYHIDGVHVWDPKPEVREQNYRNALVHLRLAVILGARTVRIDFGGRDSEMSTEQFDTIVKRFREYAAFAGDHGFKIGPETHFGPALVPENMKRVYEAVNHPAYGILLHIRHWVPGKSDEGDRMAARWAIHTHIDQATIRECLEEKIKLLLDAGYQGYWGVEHHSAKNEYAEVACQVAEVEKALIRLGAK